MTTLLVDVGNTRLKWRLAGMKLAPPEAQGQLRHATSSDLPQSQFLDELARQWHGLELEAMLYCSVASQQLTEHIVALFGASFCNASAVRVRSTAVLAGIINGYREPTQLGTDRLLAMVGARAHCAEGALLVANLGTATTLDCVDASNHFDSGAIMTGAQMMVNALAGATAHLPQVELARDAVAAPGTDTASAIRLGVLHAQAGAIERAQRLASEHYGSVTTILTGGAASTVLPHLPFAARLADNLVLDGLEVIALQGEGRVA